MPPTSPFEQGSIRPPHPLAERLCARLRETLGARVLDVGSGSGRNTWALQAAGMCVVAVSDADAAAIALPGGRFDAAVATHALLHGSAQHISDLLDAIAQRLAPGAPLYTTFASLRDARYGKGERIAERTFAPVGGDEAGVAHTFYDEAEVRSLLAASFSVRSLVETSVDDVAGRWAHPTTPLSGAVHWFVEAERR